MHVDSFIILGAHVTPRLFSLSLQGVQSPLYVSCHEGNIEMVQLLVHHHAAIDQPTDVSNALYNITSLSLYCSLSPQHTQYYSHLHYYHVHHRVILLLLH